MALIQTGENRSELRIQRLSSVRLRQEIEAFLHWRGKNAMLNFCFVLDWTGLISREVEGEVSYCFQV